jgi:uncharacterized RDD family membrane protein YckC
MNCPKCNKEIIGSDIEETKAYCGSCMEWFSIKADVIAENMSKNAPFRSNHNDDKGNKIIPVEIEGINDKIYAGFWSRLGANLLDGLILIPYSFLLLYIYSLNIYAYLFLLIPSLLISFWYNVYLPKRYGGTPGKLIVGLKIVKINSSSIGWKESFLRFSVNIVLIIINTVLMMTAVFMADQEVYSSLNWLQKSTYLSSLTNVTLSTTLTNIWVWSEVIVLLFNKRKRAIHDFIAGTVVIKSVYIEKIRRKMEEIK